MLKRRSAGAQQSGSAGSTGMAGIMWGLSALGAALLSAHGSPIAIVLAAQQPAATSAPTAGEAAAQDAIGIALGEQGRLDEAILAFTAATRADPLFADAHFHLGLALDRRGRPQEAMAAYTRALGLKPAMTQARYGLALACANAGDRDGAVILLRQVVDAAPGFAEAHYNLGLQLWSAARSSGAERGPDLDAALAELTRALTLDAHRAAYHAALGQLLVDKDRVADAIAPLQRAVALAPGDAEHAYNLGLALRLSGDLDLAETQFRRAVELDAMHALARRALGLVLRQKGDLAGAADQLRRSVAQRPGDAMGHHLLGTVLQKMSASEAAIEAYQQAVRLDPTLTEARVNLAQALARAGRSSEARAEQQEVLRHNAARANIGRTLVLLDSAGQQAAQGHADVALAQLREAVTLSPSLADAHYRLGSLLAQRQRADDARAALREAIALEPRHARAHYELAQVLERLGDRTAALEAAQRAAALAPGLLDGQRLVARLAGESARWDVAAAALESLVAWAPDGAAHHALGRVRMRQQDWRAAIVQLRAAVALVPTLGAAWADLAEALRAAGDPVEADRALAQARRVEPARAR
jgi:tetratricopeptide (TPR) repeat protein